MKSLLLLISKHKTLTGLVFIVLLLTIFAARTATKASRIVTVPLQLGEITTSIYGSGVLKTDRMFDLKLGTPAKILEIKKSIGERVSKGETLIIFDNLPAFKAPLTGRITALNYRAGETAFAQSPALSIADAKNFYLEMSLDQKSVRFVKSGQTARVSFEGYRDLKLNGLVRAVFSNDSQFFAIIDIEDPAGLFLPGMSADVAIATDRRKDLLLAPIAALKNGRLLVMKDRRPLEVDVSTGIDDGRLIEIQGSDLKPGDLAIQRESGISEGKQ